MKAAEVGRRGDTGEVVVRIDPRYFVLRRWRRCLVTQAKLRTSWVDPATTLEELVAEMWLPTGSQERAYLKRKGCCCVSTRMSLVTTSDLLRSLGLVVAAGSAICRARALRLQPSAQT